MKYLFGFLLIMSGLRTVAQENKTEFDGHAWKAPYTLGIPKGWDIERFLIPIDFAPEIPYHGVEDIRFTPGWGDSSSSQYWTYAFLWFLDGRQSLTSDIVANNLKAYYTGLVGRNIVSRKIPQEKLVKLTVDVKQAANKGNDAATFEGAVHMLDYMQQKPLTINYIIHVQYCGDKDKTFVFTEISPQAYEHDIWKELNQLWLEFDCNKPAE